MAERLGGQEPQPSSREKYFDKKMEFLTVILPVLKKATDKAQQDKDGASFFRFTMAKTRAVSDFAWMETCEQSEITYDEFAALSDRKQEKQKEHAEHAEFNKIVGVKPQGSIDVEGEPLAQKYLELSTELKAVNTDIEKVKKTNDGKGYLSLLSTKENILSDFAWMETLREASVDEEDIVMLVETKAQRKKNAERQAAEQQAFDRLTKSLGDLQTE